MTSDAGTPVTRAVPFDTDLVALHERDPGRYPFLLESTAAGTAQGRYDILMANPGATLTLDAAFSAHGEQAGDDGFLPALDRWWRACRVAPGAAPGLPFRGGWFVFLGYELAQEIEPRLGLTAGRELPVATAVRVPCAIVRDHHRGTALAMAEPGYENALEALATDAQHARGAQPLPPPPALSVEEEDPARFLEAVATAKRHIAAGDIYQANLSRAWRAALDRRQDPAVLYRRLCSANPAPFAGIARLGALTLISSSPERLVRTRGNVVETRPIAGTVPRRDGDAAPDPREALLGSEKERAEHVMLIDLERNDLGRICRGGTVQVDEFMAVESYAHVHHIVSNVRGELMDDTGPADVIRAIFPGGTITGCPKVRCMELIRDLERRPRRVYTGSMGYLNRDGDMDLNILIRTMVATGEQLSFAAGSGIVADSDPLRELAETRAKAKGLLLALSADGEG